MSQIFKMHPTTIGRQALAGICRDMGLIGFAAEIGVWRGDFAEPFYREWQGLKLKLIDPWRPLEGYDDVRAEQFDPRDRKLCELRFADDSNVSMLPMTSAEAAPLFSDSVLDFCYLDADHSFEAVTQDISLWYPKVRSGGILAGHDLFASELPGVTNAVINFALKYQLEVNVIRDNYPSWFVVKP